jgi:hypothetical protein
LERTWSAGVVCKPPFHEQYVGFPDHSIPLAYSDLDQRDTFVRILLIDYSSAFNTIVPSKLGTKLRALGLDTTVCNCILDFLTSRP